MNFFMNHWHCILPAVALIIAVVFLCRGDKQNPKN